MKTTILALMFCFLVCSSLAQQPPNPPNDPIGEQLFPPELIMQNQKAIGLSEEQRNFIKGEIQKAQSKFTDMQWQLQTEVETMGTLLKQDKSDEQQVLSQLDKVLNLEREVKKAQVTLIVRIKNKLSSEQQAQLMVIKKEAQDRFMKKRMEDR